MGITCPGNNNPVGIDIQKPSKDTVPFHPYIVIKDGFALLMFMIVFAFFVFYTPNILGHADNYIEADPLVHPLISFQNGIYYLFMQF